MRPFFSVGNVSKEANAGKLACERTLGESAGFFVDLACGVVQL
jgi:hypothetical protein